MVEKIKAFIKKQDLVTIASGGAVVIILAYLSLYTFTFCRQYISDDGKDWNDFSSALGGFVGTVINGLVAILVYNTYKLQKEEVRKLSESAQEQSDYAAEQNFQGMFRLMMEIYRKNLEEIQISDDYQTYTGVSGITYIMKQMENNTYNYENMISKNRSDHIERAELLARYANITQDLTEPLDIIRIHEIIYVYLTHKDYSYIHSKIPNTSIKNNNQQYDNAVHNTNPHMHIPMKNQVTLNRHMNHLVEVLNYILNNNKNDVESIYLKLVMNSMSTAEKNCLYLHIITTGKEYYYDKSNNERNLIKDISLRYFTDLL